MKSGKNTLLFKNAYHLVFKISRMQLFISLPALC